MRPHPKVLRDSLQRQDVPNHGTPNDGTHGTHGKGEDTKLIWLINKGENAGGIAHGGGITPDRGPVHSAACCRPAVGVKALPRKGPTLFPTGSFSPGEVSSGIGANSEQ